MDEQRAIVDQWKARAGDGWTAEGAAGHLLDALELDALWVTLEDGRLLLLVGDSLLIASLDGSEVYAEAIPVSPKAIRMRLRADASGVRFTLEAVGVPSFETIELDLHKQDLTYGQRRKLAVSLAQKLSLPVGA